MLFLATEVLHEISLIEQVEYISPLLYDLLHIAENSTLAVTYLW